MSLFETDFRKQVKDFLAPVMRGESLIDYFYSLVYPLQTNLENNQDFEVQLSDRVRYNGQKIVMQEAINNIMNVNFAPFIIIQPRETFLGIAPVLYNETEPFFTSIIGNGGEDTMIIINESEETPLLADFTVLIPVGLNNPDFEAKVRAEITLIKVAGVSFDIQTY